MKLTRPQIDDIMWDLSEQIGDILSRSGAPDTEEFYERIYDWLWSGFARDLEAEDFS